MAAECVGGAFLSATLQVLFDRLASRQVLNFFKRQKLNDKLLKKLKMLMITVNKVLNDAESKQITDSFVKEWLDELKDAVYEADDFLDEVAYEARRPEVAGSQTSTNQVQEFLSTHNPFEREKAEMEAKLEELLERLDDLIRQKDALGLIEGIGEKPSAAQKMPTTSLLDEHAVFGRKGDKEAIMKLVLSEDANGKQLDVIPIVGMGGVGKTTLARLIYNDSTVQQRFDLKAWVCVSEEFDVLKLTKDILKEVNQASSAICETMTANQLHCELENQTAGKKVLLVLDDVWSENQEMWDSLLIPFKSVKDGSKIIVTTRNDTVALIKSTVPSYHLQKLIEKDCWLVFARRAFDDGSSSAHPHLQEIGRAIVRKCDGLPLAAKALGGLLRSRRDAKEWEKVLKSEMWNSPKDPVLPALILSYYYLPSQLKQCFAYCSIFPKDFRFDKDELIRLWMAEGFLVAPKEEEVMEDVGDECFHDLASRSFFQRYSSDDPSVFIMHDLIHDLAKFVSGEFFFLLEDDASNKIAEKARHFSYVPTLYDTCKKFAGIYEAELMRTFLPLPRWRRGNRIDDKVIHDLSQRLKRLRVLSLSAYSSVAELPDSMGKLKHLRYLNLKRTSIKELPEVVGIAYNLQSLILDNCRELVKLPDSIGNLKHLRYASLRNTTIKRLPASMACLYNLRTLILQWCSDLLELPTGMGRLINLCHLDIESTKLLEMPSGMGKLTKLQKLTDFFIGKQSGSSIKELGKFQHLQGSLCIWNLQNVVNVQDAAEADLKSKKQLEGLRLIWNGDTDDSQHERNVLEKLAPHANLKFLTINGYGGTRFPDWMEVMNVGRSNSLEEIDVGKNPECFCVYEGPIVNFTYLSELSIVNCPNIVSFPLGELPAPNLRELRLWYCTKLKWLPQRMHFLLRSLEYLSLKELPEVESFPKGGLPAPNLRKLELEKCTKLKWLPELMNFPLPSLEDLSLKELPEVESFPKGGLPAPNLRKLELEKCTKVKWLPEFMNFPLPSLEDLSLKELPEVESFPKGGLPAPNLRKLELEKCKKLKWLPERMHFLLPSLEYMPLNELPEVESFPEGGLPSKLQSLHIWNCNKLIAGRMQWNLQSHPSLSSLQISKNEEVEFFPEDTMLPSTLTHLSISGLKNLKALNDGIQQLTSLRYFAISDCPELQSMPKEGLPSSLSWLAIDGCHLLKKKCEAEDWHKISYISNIYINWSKIN